MKLVLLVPHFEVCSLLSPDEFEVDVERTLELLLIYIFTLHVSLILHNTINYNYYMIL